MKKLIISLAIITAFVSCKKVEDEKPLNNNNTSSIKDTGTIEIVQIYTSFMCSGTKVNQYQNVYFAKTVIDLENGKYLFKKERLYKSFSFYGVPYGTYYYKYFTSIDEADCSPYFVPYKRLDKVSLGTNQYNIIKIQMLIN